MYKWFKVLENMQMLGIEQGEEITPDLRYIGLIDGENAYALDLHTGKFEYRNFFGTKADVTPELIEVKDPKVIRKVHMRETLTPGKGVTTKMEYAKSLGYECTYNGEKKTVTLICFHDGTEPEFRIK